MINESCFKWYLLTVNSDLCKARIKDLMKTFIITKLNTTFILT